MVAAKSHRAATGESSSSTSVQQPDQSFEEQSITVSVGEQSTLEESFLLPRVYSSDEETDSDTESDFNETSAKEIYRDWMSSQCKSDVKMMAVVLMDTFRERFGMTDVGAASEAGMVIGFNEKTVRTWRNANRGEFSESYKGKHARAFVLDDEECKSKALLWLRQHAYSKVQPAMTSARFAHWVNEELLPNSHLNPGFPRSVTPRTASKWLHALGFSPTPYRKGVYVDGHEREDVVEYREMYLRKMEILESTHLPPPPCEDADFEENIGNPAAQRKLVLLYHDESCFHANEGPSWQWAEEGKLAIRPKSIGRGIMVSDFISEHDGYLTLTDEDHERAKERYPAIPKSACVLFKYGVQSEGYWNCEKFLIQVENAAQIAEVKYPKENYTLTFILDQSSGHTAYPEDGLNARRMNVSDGGKQPKRRDTVWNCKVQSMVNASGQPKGLKTVLEERNVNTSRMNKADMIKVLENMHDFKVQKTRVEELISRHGHRCIFLPEYHCELNPIERVWGQAKRFTRANCNYTYPGLEKTIIPALESVSVALIRKYFRRVREYHRAYREGKNGGEEVESAIKLYKSHRRVPETEIV
jgi:transposase